MTTSATANNWRAFVINLADATQRWHFIETQLQDLGVEYERVAAIHGASLNYPIDEFSERSYKLLHGRRRCPPEIGCYLSHLAAGERFLKTDQSHALILEDDAALDGDIVEVINAAIGKQDEWDILRLSTVNKGRKLPYAPLTGTRQLAISLTREKGAGAYVLNRHAAERLRAKLLPMRLAYDIAFDIEYTYGLRSTFVSPVPVNQITGHPSQIQANIRAYRMPSWRYFTVFPYRTYLETSRVIVRGIRYVSLKYRYLRINGATSAQI